MKILAMSDTHNYGYPIEKLPDADLLIHSGDSCIYGTDDELVAFSNWLDHACAKYEHVVYVPGNHDKTFNGPGYDEIGRAICNQTNLTILINEVVEINGLSIYGSPNTRPIGRPWYYYMTLEQAVTFWKNEATANPTGYDVLVTHNPPNRVGDKVNNNWHHWPFVGCKAIREYVEDTQPRLHIFGHIHEGYGVYEGARTSLRTREDKPVETVFVNAAIRDEKYVVANKPWLITMERLSHGGGPWEVTSVEKV